MAGFAAASSAQASAPGAGLGAARQSMVRVIIQPGQTLWSIAVRDDPGGDPRLAVQRIIKANGLRGDGLRAGQQLWVPRG